jgi:hypothetical protein
MTGGAGQTGIAESEAWFGPLGVLQVCWGFNPPPPRGSEKIPELPLENSQNYGFYLALHTPSGSHERDSCPVR